MDRDRTEQHAVIDHSEESERGLMARGLSLSLRISHEQKCSLVPGWPRKYDPFVAKAFPSVHRASAVEYPW